MSIDEKIIVTFLSMIFAIAVQFTRHLPRDKNTITDIIDAKFLSPLYLNRDGTEKRYTKLFFTLFFLIWIPIVWIFG